MVAINVNYVQYIAEAVYSGRVLLGNISVLFSIAQGMIYANGAGLRSPLYNSVYGATAHSCFR